MAVSGISGPEVADIFPWTQFINVKILFIKRIVKQMV